MSSIPLSRILQTKKTNGELEKEQYDKQMVNNSVILYICFFFSALILCPKDHHFVFSLVKNVYSLCVRKSRKRFEFHLIGLFWIIAHFYFAHFRPVIFGFLLTSHIRQFPGEENSIQFILFYSASWF